MWRSCHLKMKKLGHPNFKFSFTTGRPDVPAFRRKSRWDSLDWRTAGSTRQRQALPHPRQRVEGSPGAQARCFPALDSARGTGASAGRNESSTTGAYPLLHEDSVRPFPHSSHEQGSQARRPAGHLARPPEKVRRRPAKAGPQNSGEPSRRGAASRCGSSRHQAASISKPWRPDHRTTSI
jgi:hypothetical protein